MVALGSTNATMKSSTTLKPFFTIITSATCMPNLQGTSQLQQNMCQTYKDHKGMNKIMRTRWLTKFKKSKAKFNIVNVVMKHSYPLLTQNLSHKMISFDRPCNLTKDFLKE